MNTYRRSECCVFRKTNEPFGGLSNMAGGFPLMVNGHLILTSEALYQACRHPSRPDVQRKILDEKSPMSAKMASKPFRNEFNRPDWEDVKTDIMRWCLHIKLAQHFVKFGTLLQQTGSRTIVEESHKDRYWGAVKDRKDTNLLSGENRLGTMLMELREYYRQNRHAGRLFVIEPLDIPDFFLLGEPIRTIDERLRYKAFIEDDPVDSKL